jgi:hypothetical protein
MIHPSEDQGLWNACFCSDFYPALFCCAFCQQVRCGVDFQACEFLCISGTDTFDFYDFVTNNLIFKMDSKLNKNRETPGVICIIFPLTH